VGVNIIDVESFISNLERHLDLPAPSGLQSGTRPRDLPEWTSLQALILVASFDWDYGVTISADEFGQAESIADLYALVTGKMQA
jgi:acyl carrier protein